jgi:hypothetical protein
MRLAPEMHIFDQQVGGEYQIFGCAGLPEDGAIVADSEHHAGAARISRQAANAVNPAGFVCGGHFSIGQHQTGLPLRSLNVQFRRDMLAPHFDFAFALAGGGQVVGTLHVQPRFR